MKEFYQKSIDIKNLKHPEKYKGYKKSVDIRSSYEYILVQIFDSNKYVLEWSNEEYVIPYYNVLDKRKHRYYIDFWAKMLDRNNNIQEYLIEVKPYKEKIMPDISGKKKTSTKFEEVKRFLINQKKWEAARLFAKNNNMQFKIITEKELGIWKK